MRVGCQDIPRLDTLAPNTGHRSSFRLDGTHQVVAFQLSNLALVLQPSLFCYPVSYHIHVHRALFSIFFLMTWASVEPDSPGLTQAAGV